MSPLHVHWDIGSYGTLFSYSMRLHIGVAKTWPLGNLYKTHWRSLQTFERHSIKNRSMFCMSLHHSCTFMPCSIFCVQYISSFLTSQRDIAYGTSKKNMWCCYFFVLCPPMCQQILTGREVYLMPKKGKTHIHTLVLNSVVCTASFCSFSCAIYKVMGRTANEIK